MLNFSSPSHPLHIAYFITPHGFGHAARASAVMAAWHTLNPCLHFHIFTTVPEWFFQDSLSGPFRYHSLYTDIGLVQITPFHEDLSQTLHLLETFFPFDQKKITSIAQTVRRLQCALLICDIAPLGIAVAREAGIPSVLIENFTWDWIYQSYAYLDRRIGQYVAYLQNIFEAADYHIQTEPVCHHQSVDLTTPPVSRNPKTSRVQTREQLGIPQDAQAVLLTMGGIPPQYTSLESLKQFQHIYFIIPGGSSAFENRNNLILFPHRSSFFHPDLIQASDAVIGKVGYSTVAEVYYAGIPFGYIARPRFRESAVLAAYIEQHMPGLAISATTFQEERWIDCLPELLALPPLQRQTPNGAIQIAQTLAQWVSGTEPLSS